MTSNSKRNSGVGDAVVVEATYGVSRHLPREERFVSKIRQIVTRGGRCLLPVVALGRAQVCALSLLGRRKKYGGFPSYWGSITR
jgi:cleavage and polyadenylation specificity factor subunit 3